MGKLCVLARRLEGLGVGAVFARRGGAAAAYLVTSVSGKADIPSASLLFRGLPLTLPSSAPTASAGAGAGAFAVGAEARLHGERKDDWTLLAPPPAARAALVARAAEAAGARAAPAWRLRGDAVDVAAAVRAGAAPFDLTAEAAALAARRAARRAKTLAAAAAAADATAAKLAALAAARAAARAARRKTPAAGDAAAAPASDAAAAKKPAEK
jgi:hypothetical protein